jgi:hypothetical protein
MRTIGKPKDPPTQSEWTEKRHRSTMARRMKRATPEPFLYVTAIINFHFWDTSRQNSVWTKI